MTTAAQNKKVTMATLKSFIKKSDKLFAENLSSFDGMTDCVELTKNSKLIEVSKENAIGHSGVWCVGQSRDYMKYVETTTMIGIEVYNCCGCGILWTNK
jgi:hypothetical protein